MLIFCFYFLLLFFAFIFYLSAYISPPIKRPWGILIKKHLQKILPDIDQIGLNSKRSRIRHYFLDSRLWHINRRSIAKGASIGLFIAFLPLPGQMLFACLLALFWRANLPIAVTLTWITNPITFVPINFFIYKVGRLFFPHENPAVQNFIFEDKSVREIALHFIQWIQSAGKPFLMGTPIVAFSAAIIGYFAVKLFWWFSVLLRLRRRRHQRHQRHQRRRNNTGAFKDFS